MKVVLKKKKNKEAVITFLLVVSLFYRQQFCLVSVKKGGESC